MKNLGFTQDFQPELYFKDINGYLSKVQVNLSDSKLLINHKTLIQLGSFSINEYFSMEVASIVKAAEDNKIKLIEIF